MRIISVLSLFIIIGAAPAFSVEAQEKIGKGFMFMGLDTGNIVRVELRDWSVRYYPAERSRHFSVRRMKYFSCCEKLVFEIFGIETYMGVIDVKEQKLAFVSPSEGLATGRTKLSA